MKLYKRKILYGVCILLFLMFTSCVAGKTKYTKNNTEVQKSKNDKNAGVFSDVSSSDELRLSKAYIEPSFTYDILLNTKPETAEGITNKKKIIKDIKDGINAEEKLFKYLEQKRQYAKTSIFAETP